MLQAPRRYVGFAPVPIHVLFLAAGLLLTRFPFCVPLSVEIIGDNSRDEGRRYSPVLALDAGFHFVSYARNTIWGLKPVALKFSRGRVRNARSYELLFSTSEQVNRPRLHALAAITRSA
jgi:hypothetical protein